MFAKKIKQLLLASLLIASRTHPHVTYLYNNFVLNYMFTYLGSRFFHYNLLNCFAWNLGR